MLSGIFLREGLDRLFGDLPVALPCRTLVSRSRLRATQFGARFGKRRRAHLLRFQLADDGSAFCRIDLIERSTRKACHEWGRCLHLLSAASSKRLIEQVLARRRHLRCADAKIVGAAAFDLDFGFLIHGDRIDTGYPVSTGRSVYGEIQSFGHRTNRLAIDLNS